MPNQKKDKLSPGVGVAKQVARAEARWKKGDTEGVFFKEKRKKNVLRLWLLD